MPAQKQKKKFYSSSKLSILQREYERRTGKAAKRNDKLTNPYKKWKKGRKVPTEKYSQERVISGVKFWRIGPFFDSKKQAQEYRKAIKGTFEVGPEAKLLIQKFDPNDKSNKNNWSIFEEPNPYSEKYHKLRKK